MSSGLLATIAWFVVLIIYCAFRAFGIEDPLLGQAFLLLTGAWVGNLTLAKGKRDAKVEEKVDTLEKIVTLDNPEVAAAVAYQIEKLQGEMKTEQKRNTALEERADVSEVRADHSETREGEWSQHKDHKGTEGHEPNGPSGGHRD